MITRDNIPLRDRASSMRIVKLDIKEEKTQENKLTFEKVHADSRR
jgi:hypothetical protein